MSRLLNDRNPNIFFVETIGNFPFVFDNKNYQSVFDCFKRRAIFNNLWHPNTVPEFHQTKLSGPVGFLINEDTNLCYKINYDGNVRNLNNNSKQFGMLVCAKLFTMYFKQIYNKCNSDSREKLMRRYGEAYTACEQVCSNISLNTEVIDLTDYKVSDSTYDYCAVVYDGRSELPKEVILPKCHSIRMSSDTFKSLSKKGYGWTKLFPEDIPIKISCDDVNDYYWELVRFGGYEPILEPYGVGYRGAYTIFLNKVNDEEINREVNWDNAYVYGA